MLLSRVITALIFGALIIAAIFNLSDSHFFLMTAVFIAACSWEWGSLINIKTLFARCLLVFFMLISFVISFWLPLGTILLGSVCWWSFVTTLLLTYPKSRHMWAEKKWYGIFMGVTSILPAGLAINVLKHYNQGAFVVLYALLLVILADSAAYFAGRSFGRRPLASKLSPKKTIEGLIGGLVVTFVFSVLGAMYFHLSVAGSAFFVVVSMISVAFSVVGDLYISMLKRERGVKDTGKLLPGHGGILDRLDGINAAIPIFTFGLMLLTWWFV
jgi:phosphatidate cytidylyltransferase